MLNENICKKFNWKTLTKTQDIQMKFLDCLCRAHEIHFPIN